MKSNIYFLESERSFNAQTQRRIRKIIEESAKDSANILKTNQKFLNFTVYPFDVYVRGKPFLPATTITTEWIELIMPKDWEEDLRGTIYHETHHAFRGTARYRHEDLTLLGAVFSEGLATVYERQKARYPRGYAEYKEKTLKKFFPEFRKAMSKNNFSWEYWFLGEGKRWWLGYKLGTYLVEQIFKHYPDTAHADLIHREERELLKLSQVKI